MILRKLTISMAAVTVLVWAGALPALADVAVDQEVMVFTEGEVSEEEAALEDAFWGVEREEEQAEAAAAQLSVGQQVSGFAAQFVGNPYRYGGTSLTKGADCSGFVMSVYRQFGVSLPHSSSALRQVGVDVGGLQNAQAGDIVVYPGHVGIYMGNNQLVHASNEREGIKISPANYRKVLSVRRVI